MSDGRLETEWDQMAQLIAKLHNVNCVKRSSLISADQIHPFHVRRETAARASKEEQREALFSLVR